GSEPTFVWRRSENDLGKKKPLVHPTEIRTLISPSSGVWLNTNQRVNQLRHRGGLHNLIDLIGLPPTIPLYIHHPPPPHRVRNYSQIFHVTLAVSLARYVEFDSH
ncbi:unnamed protein product, partial [Timema podura]|nr:unnamed protein product [Timema podura]